MVADIVSTCGLPNDTAFVATPLPTPSQKSVSPKTIGVMWPIPLHVGPKDTSSYHFGFRPNFQHTQDNRAYFAQLSTCGPPRWNGLCRIMGNYGESWGTMGFNGNYGVLWGFM